MIFLSFYLFSYCPFFNLFFYFTILYWFCHALTRIHHGCTWILNPEPPSRHPLHIISLDHPRAPAPSILYPVSNIDWWFVSYMIVYMFQCHSPKSSHHLPLPQGPKVRSIHLCLPCCLAYRVIIIIFLNSIYMCTVQFSHSAMSDSLRPHELQLARPPCPSPTPGVHSDSCHWVGDAIQPSHPLSSPSLPVPNPSQHQSFFQWVNCLHEVAKVLEFQL